MNDLEMSTDPSEETGVMNERWKSRLVRFWRNWAKPFLVVIVVLSTFRSAVADWNDVPTGSMRPTILEGDRIFVNKLAYDLKVPFTTWRLCEWSGPTRGDIVVLFAPDTGTRLVKRVVAGPGDVVELRRNRLFINGTPAVYDAIDTDTLEQLDPDERRGHGFATESVEGRPHAVMTTTGAHSASNFGPITLATDQYFVMGDNRDASRDSRYFGAVDRKLILGRVPAIVLSLDRDRYFLPRVSRFFRSIP